MAIKPIISSSYSLLDYLPDYNVFDVYLAYVKTKGYVLINYAGSRYWFKSFESTLTPDRFYLNYDKTEVYLEIIDTIRTYLEPYKAYLNNDKSKVVYPYEIEEKIEDITLDLLDKLAEDLKDRYKSDSFVGVGDFKEKQMKEFILTPVKTFNDFLNYDNNKYVVDSAEAYNIQQELEAKAEDLAGFFNSKLPYYKVKYTNTGEEIRKPIFKPNDLYKLCIKTVEETVPSHIFNLKTKGSKYDKTEGALELASVFNIKKTLKNENEVVYYYNEENKYYEETTEKGLKNLIFKTYGFNLAESDLKALYVNIPFEDKLYNNLLVFNNCLFDTNTLNKLQGIYNRRNYLTVNKIGFKTNGSSTIHLLDYDSGALALEVEDILTIKEPEEAETLTEKTLREILIPKTNPEDISLYQDFLERTGAKILGRNLFKTITFYFTSYSNSGKTILNLFNDLLFNEKNISIIASTFEDKSFFKNFEGALAINIDEIDKDSFKTLKPELKRISSSYSKTDIRNMYSESKYTIENYPEITIYSNVKLDLDPISDYALFERIDFLKLPNRFVSSKELNKFNNAYLKNDKLVDMLKEDTVGLNWLITASIKCFKDMIKRNDRYTLKQTVEESIDIYLDSNYIVKFLTIYTEEAPELTVNNYVHVKEIKEEFLKYITVKGINLKEAELNNLSKDIGLELSKLYDFKQGAGKERDSIGTKYKIKLKSLEEVAIEFKQVYNINEEISDSDLNSLNYLTSDSRLIYRKIQAGVNTINQLNKAYPEYNVLEIVKELEEVNLIYNTFTTKLTED